MKVEEALRETLRALAAESAEAAAPPEVEKALLAAVRARRPRRAFAWWPVAAAAALVIGVVAGSMNWKPAPVAVMPRVEIPVAKAPEVEAAPAPLPVRSAIRRTAPPRWSDGPVRERPLTPWYFHQGLPPVARGEIVRMKVSAEEAAPFGVYAPGARVVKADVLLGADGMVRAIRFVR